MSSAFKQSPAPSMESQPINAVRRYCVTVPPWVQPGTSFAACIDEFNTCVMIVCPQDVRAGNLIELSIPVNEASLREVRELQVCPEKKLDLTPSKASSSLSKGPDFQKVLQNPGPQPSNVPPMGCEFDPIPAEEAAEDQQRQEGQTTTAYKHGASLGTGQGRQDDKVDWGSRLFREAEQRSSSINPLLRSVAQTVDRKQESAASRYMEYSRSAFLTPPPQVVKPAETYRPLSGHQVPWSAPASRGAFEYDKPYARPTRAPLVWTDVLEDDPILTIDLNNTKKVVSSTPTAATHFIPQASMNENRANASSLAAASGKERASNRKSSDLEHDSASNRTKREESGRRSRRQRKNVNYGEDTYDSKVEYAIGLHEGRKKYDRSSELRMNQEFPQAYQSQLPSFSSPVSQTLPLQFGRLDDSLTDSVGGESLGDFFRREVSLCGIPHPDRTDLQEALTKEKMEAAGLGPRCTVEGTVVQVLGKGTSVSVRFLVHGRTFEGYLDLAEQVKPLKKPTSTATHKQPTKRPLAVPELSAPAAEQREEPVDDEAEESRRKMRKVESPPAALDINSLSMPLAVDPAIAKDDISVDSCGSQTAAKEETATSGKGEGCGAYFILSVREEWRSERGFRLFEVASEDWSTKSKDEETTSIELNVREWYCARELEPPEGFAKGEQRFLPKSKGHRKRTFPSGTWVSCEVSRHTQKFGSKSKTFIMIEDEEAKIDEAYNKLTTTG
mmetsp:Transcript_26904/g.87995  ORF Transcript_26904/g.87995 Transcript_26904/m.87995 type:complete len:728 (-) Transcript_26904:158-2341(-)